MAFIRVEGDILSGRCLAPVYIGHPVNYVHGMHLTALLDTGATDSAVSVVVAGYLGLPIVGQAALHSPTVGQGALPRYAAQLEFWRYGLQIGGAAQVLRHHPLIGCDHVMSGIQLLIGLDILGAAASFKVENGRWTLSWDAA